MWPASEADREEPFEHRVALLRAHERAEVTTANRASERHRGFGADRALQIGVGGAGVEVKERDAATCERSGVVPGPH
jgi:hypothetical protein